MFEVGWQAPPGLSPTPLSRGAGVEGHLRHWGVDKQSPGGASHG